MWREVAWFVIGACSGAFVAYVLVAIFNEPWDDDDWPNV